MQLSTVSRGNGVSREASPERKDHDDPRKTRQNQYPLAYIPVYMTTPSLSCRRRRYRMVFGFTNVVSSNPAHGDGYPM